MRPHRSGLAVPCHWNREQMVKILDFQGDISVVEVYGVLADGGSVGHGRAVDTVPKVSRADALDFRRWLGSRGVQFNYLLNAPYDVVTAREVDELDEYLSWILDELQPDTVTISSYGLMRYVRDRYKDIRINISTIASVRKASDLEKYLDVRPSRVVVHHDLGKEWSLLEEIVKFGRKHNIDTELLVNESCLLHCNERERHYTYLAKKPPKDLPFMTTCNAQKLHYPREFLLAGGAIRPEDLYLFEEMGVNYFKIAGRDRSAEWLPEVVRAYQERNYEGNFIRLLDIAPSIEAEDWVYLSNKAQDGFMKAFPHAGTYDEQAAYADQWMARLYREGDFHVEGAEYEVRDGVLVLRQAGSKVKALFDRLKV